MSGETIQTMIGDQWRLESTQLVNWGCYDGYHEFTPAYDDGAIMTLVAGDSESGKSTLLDSHTAVLYPTGYGYNRASNGGRSERGIYSYLKGALGNMSNNGKETEYLRGSLNGEPAPVWGAVIETYENNDGAILSFGMFLTLPAGGAVNELKRTWLSWDSRIDPRIMDAYRGTSITPSKLADAYPGCRTYESGEKCHDYVWGRLGLTKKACRLLAKVQSSEATGNGDGVFKSLVLEVPDAIGKAEQTVGDYDAFKNNLDSMERSVRQLAALDRLHDRLARYDEAATQAGAYTGIDPDDTEGAHTIDTMVTRRLRGEVVDGRRMLDTELADAQSKSQTAETRYRDETTAYEELAREYEERGGGEVDRLNAKLEDAQAQADRIHREHERVARAFDQAGRTMPMDGDAWNRDIGMLQHDETGYTTRMEEIENRLTGLRVKSRDLAANLDQLRGDYQVQAAGDSRVPADMEETRRTIAGILGVNVEDIPYAAQLMDVAKDQERWRTAVNAVYRELGSTILVDAALKDTLAPRIAAIKPNGLRRVKVMFARTGMPVDPKPRDGWASGTLVYRTGSPYAGWLATITGGACDARCVDTIDTSDNGRQVRDDGFLYDGAATVSHGLKTRDNRPMESIIGFADEQYLRELRERIDTAQQQVDQTSGEIQAALDQRRSLESAHTLTTLIEGVTWTDVDEQSALERVDRIETMIDSLQSDPDVIRLGHMVEEARIRQRNASDEAARARDLVAATQNTIHQAGEWLERHPETSMEGTETILTKETGMILDAAYKAVPMTGDGGAADRTRYIIGTHDGAINRMIADTIRKGKRDADRDRDAQRETVETLMDAYLREYEPDENRVTATVGDRNYFTRERDIVSTQAAPGVLGEEYRSKVDDLYRDFVSLNNALRRDKEDVIDKLALINQKMSQLRYGAKHGRLTIQPEVNDPDKTFRGALTRIINRLTDAQRNPDRSDDETKRLFAECRPMVDKLRQELDSINDKQGPFERYGARNLDPRCRSRFPAIVEYEDGVIERIESTGGKSGGALQEFTSFVYGAALVYQLGGGDIDAQPSYTTLFLDEAFTKADRQFTRRAMKVLSALGFQIIAATPNSKVSEIMALSNKACVVRKNLSTGKSRIDPIEAIALGREEPDGENHA
ncbi:hypothetical protein CSQ85_11925 [Bifidobacterium rousetti]|uniref:ATP-binding protein n=1 Tax=Bifidobacterium rousetti TaxID=2045439 RepID=UPI00123ADC84|nr:SbcC/MukB-like Walker B domain-containing protein [Bifidobacterium rousetti]KAA8816125.1 hypothetical protein CSQ85_11925 [Bifidobacterium rousetti]